MAQKSLNSWSWKSIQDVYRILGKQIQEYAGVAERIDIPSNINIDYSDNDNVFILRFWRDVKRVNQQIKALDDEITRRNNLIGVIG